MLASNRDEFFARASQPLAWWQPSDGAAPILGGRELKGGGIWMGLSAAGRLAPVTSVREPGRRLAASPSRGELVLQCLANPQADLAVLAKTPCNGFNLLTVDLAADPWEQPEMAVGQWFGQPRTQSCREPACRPNASDNCRAPSSTLPGARVGPTAPLLDGRRGRSAGRHSVHVPELTQDASGREASMRAERFELPSQR